MSLSSGREVGGEQAQSAAAVASAPTHAAGASAGRGLEDVSARPGEVHEFGDAYEVALAREWEQMLESSEHDLLAPADGSGVGDVRWHEAPPSGDLAQLLASLVRTGFDELDDFELVELAAAAHRTSSWAHHVAALAAGALAERECMRPAVPGSITTALTPTRLAGEELGLRLGWSARAGQGLVREGTGYAGHLHATGEALRTGLIDPQKARAIVDGLDGVPVELALGVQDMVLPRAPQRTTRQLAADVRAAIVELDPPEAVARREAAMDRRHVTKPVPLGDGMAGLWLRTGAIDATALYESIDRAARSARARGDSRTLDQLRADLLVERGLHGTPCGGSRSAGSAFGTSTTEAEVGASRAGGVGARATDTGRSRRGAEPLGPEDLGTGSSSAGTRCTTAVRTDVRVLIPLSTLLGTNDETALLEGYGPIDPDLARSLARGGVWRRLVTDPMSGTVLDVGRTRYTPPADLAEHVRYRDLECVRPGCGASAWHSELDHITPYGTGTDDATDGGTTSADNLAPLSKGCHQIKTHGGFDLERTSATTYRWTTPTGHTYDVDPPPPIRALSPEDPIHEARRDLDFLTSAPSPPAGSPPPGSPPPAGPPPPEPDAPRWAPEPPPF